MFRRALLCALALVLATAAPAFASPDHHSHRHRHSTSWSDDGGDRGGNYDDDSSNDDSDSSDGSSGDSTDSPGTDTGGAVVTPQAGAQAVTGGTVKTGTAQTITAELTAYDNTDNQGGNNATICCGIWHRTASGDGTYASPITAAVPGSGSSMQTPAGTRLYIPALKAYFGVEDSGATQEKLRRFDLWIDGRGLSSASACMDKVTRTTTVILNPPPGEPVGHVGPIADATGCHVATNGNG
jgi:hypothetical protein